MVKHLLLNVLYLAPTVFMLAFMQLDLLEALV